MPADSQSEETSIRGRIRVAVDSMEQEIIDEVIPGRLPESAETYHDDGDYVVSGVTEQDVADLADAFAEQEREYSQGGMPHAASDASSVAYKLDCAEFELLSDSASRLKPTGNMTLDAFSNAGTSAERQQSTDSDSTVTSTQTTSPQPSSLDTEEDVISVALSLLETVVTDEMPVSEVLTVIESVTTSQIMVRKILSRAQETGVFERDYDTVIPSENNGGGISLSDNRIVRKGDFKCARCGQSIETGYFLQFGAGEVGPFGSTCIEKVSGGGR